MRVFALLLSLMGALIISCGGGGGGGSSQPSAGTGGGGAVQDKGDFVLGTYATNYNLNMNAIRDMFKIIADELNATLSLNKDIKISSTDCKTVNAFYSPSRSEIFMCTEMLVTLINYFGKKTTDANTAVSYALYAYLFIFGHELGHALIDNYSLPVLGKEEDAADAISVVMLIESAEDQQGRQEGVMAVLLGALFMNDMTQNTPYYDSHSMGSVRLANLVCWAGGAEPQVLQKTFFANIYNQMVKSGRDCEREYMQQRDSVFKLMGPYIKE